MAGTGSLHQVRVGLNSSGVGLSGDDYGLEGVDDL
jgi:hypothetical protein